METTTRTEDDRSHGAASLALAGLCRHCGICPYAARRPHSAFDEVMRWHRTWCPAWKAHSKVYGEKPLN